MKRTSYHKTAIGRSKPSAPAKWLYDNVLDKGAGAVLDYGCGRGFDCSHFGWEGYDPNHPSEEFSLYIAGEFDTILCTYVLNVIPGEADRYSVIKNIKSLLTDDGVAYISVRNDKAHLKGFTNRGSWQGFIEFDYPIIHKTSGYIIYKVAK